MTRILFVHQASTIGGGSFCLLNIIKELDRHYYTPVICLKGDGPLVQELQKLNTEVVFFHEMTAIPYNDTLLKVRNLVAYACIWPSMSKLKKILLDYKIDILYLNNMMLYPYLRVGKECGCKTAIHIREHWPLNEHTRQLKVARSIVYKFADELIAINHYSASIFPNKRATIVYDWVNMESRYKNIPLNVLFGENVEDKKVVLCTGGAQSIKGTDYIVKTFIDNVDSDEYRLLILGVKEWKPLHGWKHRIKTVLEHFGYYYYEKQLRENISSDSRIRCVPAIYELSHIIEQSHCFVSYFRIPHANLALAESIIMGKPSIAADTEESREYSGNGKYAKLVGPLNDLSSFTQSFTSFLRNIEKWQVAAQEGSTIIKGMFDPIENSNRLNAVLYKLQKTRNER